MYLICNKVLNICRKCVRIKLKLIWFYKIFINYKFLEYILVFLKVSKSVFIINFFFSGIKMISFIW